MCPQVPDYLEFVSQPMDFSTMRSKLEAHGYHSLADLETDFNLMVSNCLLYNSKDTVFHRAGQRLRDLGGAILRHAQRQAQNTGLDLDSGMHLSESPQKHDFYSCTWEDGELMGQCEAEGRQRGGRRERMRSLRYSSCDRHETPLKINSGQKI